MKMRHLPLVALLGILTGCYTIPAPREGTAKAPSGPVLSVQEQREAIRRRELLDDVREIRERLAR